MIKHKPKFYVKLAGFPVSLPGNFQVYTGSIYGRCMVESKSVFWVCDNYALINEKLPIHIYDGNFWKLIFVSSTHLCYKWVKNMVENLGQLPYVDKEKVDFSELMKTYSLHKKGSGSRINTNQINQPLRWNEVTEIAHWYGKGNASIVACSIK